MAVVSFMDAEKNEGPKYDGGIYRKESVHSDPPDRAFVGRFDTYRRIYVFQRLEDFSDQPHWHRFDVDR
jgi:hypothetical protein